MSALASELSPSPGASDGGRQLSELIRARSSALGAQTYIEHARDERGLTFRDLDHAVEGWARHPRRERRRPRIHRWPRHRRSDRLLGRLPRDDCLGALGGARSTRAPPARAWTSALARVQARHRVLRTRPRPAGLRAEWVDRGRTSVAAGWSADDVSGGAVLASSGTTGVPKVIPLHQGHLLHTARSVSDHHRLTPSDRGFNSLPLFHINAEVVGLLASLVAGSCLVLDDRFHRTRFWALMAERRITWINAVPAIISRLATPDFDEVIPSRIRFIRSASAPLPVATSPASRRTPAFPWSRPTA